MVTSAVWAVLSHHIKAVTARNNRKRTSEFNYCTAHIQNKSSRCCSPKKPCKSAIFYFLIVTEYSTWTKIKQFIIPWNLHLVALMQMWTQRCVCVGARWHHCCWKPFFSRRNQKPLLTLRYNFPRNPACTFLEKRNSSWVDAALTESDWHWRLRRGVRGVSGYIIKSRSGFLAEAEFKRNSSKTLL